MTGPTLQRIAARHGCTAAQVVFRFATHVGMIPLTGSTSAAHLRQDLAALDLALDDDEVQRIERLD